METRLFALVLGVLYVVIGVLGLISAFYTTAAAGAPHVDVTTLYGYLFGFFPVNIVADLFHVVIGLAGIAAGAPLATARSYSQMLFLVFGVVTIMCFIPTLNTVWGLMPLFGHDSWPYALTSLAGAYFGYVATEPTYVEPAPATAH